MTRPKRLLPHRGDESNRRRSHEAAQVGLSQRADVPRVRAEARHDLLLEIVHVADTARQNDVRAASRAASMARCGAFSGTTRPDHTHDRPPSPRVHCSVSTPLGKTNASTPSTDQARAVAWLTATKRWELSRTSAAASSSGSSGGVWRVVTTGMSASTLHRMGAGWRLWFVDDVEEVAVGDQAVARGVEGGVDGGGVPGGVVGVRGILGAGPLGVGRRNSSVSPRKSEPSAAHRVTS